MIQIKTNISYLQHRNRFDKTEVGGNFIANILLFLTFQYRIG